MFECDVGDLQHLNVFYIYIFYICLADEFPLESVKSNMISIISPFTDTAFSIISVTNISVLLVPLLLCYLLVT